MESENDLTFHAGEGSSSMEYLRRNNENRFAEVRQRINSFYSKIIPFDDRTQFNPTAKRYLPDLWNLTQGMRETLIKNLDEFSEEEFRDHCERYEDLSRRLILQTIFKMKRIA